MEPGGNFPCGRVNARPLVLLLSHEPVDHHAAVAGPQWAWLAATAIHQVSSAKRHSFVWVLQQNQFYPASLSTCMVISAGAESHVHVYTYESRNCVYMHIP